MGKKRTGFTLAEILVVVGIISIIVMMSLGYYAGVTKRGRDAKRKADLEQIRSGIEMYKIDHLGSGYPTDLNLISNYLIGDVSMNDPFNSVYLYKYKQIDANNYCLGAYLENDNPDTAHKCDIAGTPCEGQSMMCNKIIGANIPCNYCVFNL